MCIVYRWQWVWWNSCTKETVVGRSAHQVTGYLHDRSFTSQQTRSTICQFQIFISFLQLFCNIVIYWNPAQWTHCINISKFTVPAVQQCAQRQRTTRQRAFYSSLLSRQAGSATHMHTHAFLLTELQWPFSRWTWTGSGPTVSGQRQLVSLSL